MSSNLAWDATCFSSALELVRRGRLAAPLERQAGSSERRVALSSGFALQLIDEAFYLALKQSAHLIKTHSAEGSVAALIIADVPQFHGTLGWT